MENTETGNSYLVEKKIVENSEETFITLKNIKTGTIEKNVLNDSAREGYDEFSFMEVGQRYNCKLLLRIFNLAINGEDYEILSKEKVGEAELLRIQNLQGDQYFISQEDDEGREIPFHVGNKITIDSGIHQIDLIQADDVIHGALLNDPDDEDEDYYGKSKLEYLWPVLFVIGCLLLLLFPGVRENVNVGIYAKGTGVIGIIWILVLWRIRKSEENNNI